MPPLKRRSKGLLAALFSTLFFASYSVLGKLLLEDLAPITLLAITQAVSVLMLIFFFGLLPELKGLKKMPGVQLAWVVIIAILSGVLAPLLALTGLEKTSAVNTMMLGRLEVVAAGIISVLWLKEKVSHVQVTGVIMMLFGVITIATHGFTVHINFSGGESFVIGAALLWALANVLFRKFLHTLKPEIMVLVRNTLGAITLLVVLPFFLPVYHDLSVLDNRQILLKVALFSMLSIILAQFLWYRSLELISTTLASAISLLMPVFGLILAVIVLKEKLLLYHLWGGVFVLLGLVFNVIHRHRHPQDHHHWWQRLLHGFHL